MYNIKLQIAYDGTDYGGFQVQKNSVTIQEKLEDALSKIYGGAKIRITGAGRTDAGVHARGQAVNYKAEAVIPADRIPWALNTVLPGDIIVWEASEVDDSFHARNDAFSKVYTYTIDTSVFVQVLRRRYAWHCPDPVNIRLMEEGCNILEGTHDFRVFQAAGKNIKDTVRTIYGAKVTLRENEQIVYFRVEGNGFLYKMVRFMAGALVEMGKGILSPEVLKDALKGSPVRVAPALPAKGLCLEKVNYRNKK